MVDPCSMSAACAGGRGRRGDFVGITTSNRCASVRAGAELETAAWDVGQDLEMRTILARRRHDRGGAGFATVQVARRGALTKSTTA
jgi:hypothetical protein